MSSMSVDINYQLHFRSKKKTILYILNLQGFILCKTPSMRPYQTSAFVNLTQLL